MTPLASCHKQGSAEDGVGSPLQGSAYHVKNVNPSTPLVYPNRRCHKITTTDANTYCGCDSAVTYFSAMSNKGTCSTPTPKCTSDSFFSSPDATHNGTGQQEPGQAHSHSPQTKKGSKMFQCGYCFKCPRWHCSSVLFGTLDTTPLSRCLNWETRFQVSDTQPSLKGCWNNSKLLWYTNHLVTKTSETFPKVLKSNWFSFKCK